MQCLNSNTTLKLYADDVKMYSIICRCILKVIRMATENARPDIARLDNAAPD